jgi:S1-C subfamily serine protease
VERLRPSVVHILTETATIDVFGQVAPQRGVGTGVIIDDQGHILTNNHVVVQPGTCDEPARSITVTLSDGRQFSATVVGRDVPTDLAVLRIDAQDLTPVTLGDASLLQVGDDVVAIGNALDLPGGPTVTKGVVSAKDRLIEEEECGITIPDAIQTDAAINPGNSGGPLVNVRGEVIGITTAVIRGVAEGVGFAISVDTVKPIAAELIDKGRVERGFLGIRQLVTVTPSLAEQFDLPVDRGVAFQGLVPDGPAQRAGLLSGDIIVKVAEREIRTSGDLFATLTEHRSGETVSVEYYRGNDRQQAEVTLG